MFAVMNGFIIATILSSTSSRHRYKERMDMIVVSPLPLLSFCASNTLCSMDGHVHMHILTSV